MKTFEGKKGLTFVSFSVQFSLIHSIFSFDYYVTINHDSISLLSLFIL